MENKVNLKNTIKDKKQFEKAALNGSIDILDTLFLKDIPKDMYQFFFKPFSKNKNEKITVCHLLACYGLTDTLITLTEQKKKELKLTNNKPNKDTQVLNVIESDYTLESANPYPELLIENDYIENKRLQDKDLEPLSLIDKRQTIINIINNNLSFYSNTDNKEINIYLRNNDANFIKRTFSHKKSISFMDIILVNNDKKAFDYLLQENLKENYSFLSILDSLKASFKTTEEKTLFYPKKIIHNLVKQHYNPYVEKIEQEKLNTKEHWPSSSIFSRKILEFTIIKNQDEKAFELLMENKSFYEKNPEIFLNIGKSLLTGTDRKSWDFFYTMIEKNNIDLNKDLLIYYFEKSNADKNKDKIFNIIMEEKGFYFEHFKNICQEKEPLYQNNFHKVQYLLDLGIEIDTKKIRNKLYSKVNTIEKRYQDYKRRKEQTGSEIIIYLRDFNFINQTIDNIPSLLSKEEKEDILELYKKNEREISSLDNFSSNMKNKLQERISFLENHIISQEIFSQNNKSKKRHISL